MEKDPEDYDIEILESEKYNQSRRAEKVLEHILRVDSEKLSEGEVKPTVAVEEEIKARPILDIDSGRTKSRVLFISTDEKLLSKDSSDRQAYFDLAEVFDEVHVMVLVPRAGHGALERATGNVWFYRVQAKHWWQLPAEARKAAVEGLTFNNSVRPDVIVAIDPFEAAWAAYLVAKEFRRPWQIHVKTDFFRPDFKLKQKSNKWRLRLARYLLKRVGSVRTETEQIKKNLGKQFPSIKDLYVLPHHYNFTGLLNARLSSYLHDKYKDYAFIIVAFGPLTADSYMHELFTALRRLLINPHVGLVVIGDGPAQNLFTEKVRLLGIEKSVVFIKAVDDLVPVLKSADAMVEVDTSQDSEVRVLRAAAAGLPLVAKTTDLRADLLPDSDASYLCPEDDLLCIGEKITKLINDPAIRHRFEERSKSIASDRLQEDPNRYKLAFRDTIEAILVPPEAKNNQ